MKYEDSLSIISMRKAFKTLKKRQKYSLKSIPDFEKRKKRLRKVREESVGNNILLDETMENLENNGFKVLFASDGNEAVNLVLDEISDKVPLEIKMLGLAIYAQTSSARRTVRALSELHPISKTSVWNWIKKFEGELPIATERKPRNLVAVDETVVKARKKYYCVYSAVDVEINELILMRVYTTRNHLTTKSFVKEVLKYCENKPKFIVDKAWLINALKSLGLDFERNAFGKRSKVESVFSSLKQRIKIFFCSISCSNPVRNWNKFCKLFMLYYNHLRWLS